MFIPVLVWYAVAPPIASTVWMCLLLGFRPILAMELVAMTSLIALYPAHLSAACFYLITPQLIPLVC